MGHFHRHTNGLLYTTIQVFSFNNSHTNLIDFKQNIINELILARDHCTNYFGGNQISLPLDAGLQSPHKAHEKKMFFSSSLY